MARLLRAAIGLRKVAAVELTQVDVASWQLHLPVEIQLYTTRGGRWPERRSLPEGSPGSDWSHTRAFVLRRFDGTPRQDAATALSEADDSAAAAPLLEALLDVSSDN